jgi:hypothetical protein
MNTAKGPVENCNLDEAAPQRSNSLTKEESSWWELHVVAKLQVLRIHDTLVHGNITISLEGHHGQWSSWKHVADLVGLDGDRMIVHKTYNELSEDIETNLNVGNGLDHSNRLEELKLFCMRCNVLTTIHTALMIKAMTSPHHGK